MDWTLIIEMLGVLGMWSGILLTVGGFLHRSRTETLNTIRFDIRQLANQADTEHGFLKAQVADLTSSIVDNYVQRRDFEQAVVGLHEDITGARREVGEVNNRINQLYQTVEFHRRPTDG